MKNLRKLAIICIMSVAFTAMAEHRNDFGNLERYSKANAELNATPNNGDRVVLLGNSITDGWPGKSPEFFRENPNIIGRGISGQSSYQFLVRFREDVVDLKPAVVVINAATNDVAENSHEYNEDRTMGNIKSMVEIARANGIKVILTTTLPAASFPWRREIQNSTEKIVSLNKRIAAYAKKNKIPFVDYYSHLLDADGRRLNPEYSKDGVHPVAAGYAVMESLILPVINKQLGKKAHKAKK